LTASSCAGLTRLRGHSHFDIGEGTRIHAPVAESTRVALLPKTRYYDDHHLVEQTAAERDGFPRSMIDAPDNLVRIPTLKHWLITGWYQMPNPDFDWLSPRQYLRGKSWKERVRIGKDALIRFGILQP